MAFKIPGAWREEDKGLQGVGMTVGQGSTYLGDGDSAFWAIVAEPKEGGGWEWKNVGTGYWQPQEFVIDAPEEVLEAYRAELAEKARVARLEAARARAEMDALEEYWESQEPKRGRTVRAVKGRKIPVGTEGVVVWYGDSNYGGKRLAIEIDGERVYSNADNFEVISPAPLPFPEWTRQAAA